MKVILFCVCLMLSLLTQAQHFSLSAKLQNKNGEALMYASAVLLNPNDSTLMNYGVSRQNGMVSINNIKEGNYLFQVSFIGYKTYIKNISITDNIQYHTITLYEENVNINEVEVTALRRPFTIKDDTIEYNAGSFQVKPDAAVEEILKKLPGVQVDRTGNIKAQGENIQKVFVDGKEFFGDDPLVATKNLPADAVDKIQVYNKKTEETELTGIDDGSYSKAINIILKDGKKSAIFGDITAGVGSYKRYKTAAKLYRFTKTYQFAALGMLNNINKYGFSFNDYINFSGGIQSMLGNGGQLSISDDGTLPVDFGQLVHGLVSSGALGTNFTYEAKPDKRFNISYLGSGKKTDLHQISNTDHFIQDRTFQSIDSLDQLTQNSSHRINFIWKNKINQSKHLTFSGYTMFNRGESDKYLATRNSENDILYSQIDGTTRANASALESSISALYLHKFDGQWRYLKINVTGNMKQNTNDKTWKTLSTSFVPFSEVYYQTNLNNNMQSINYQISASITRYIKGKWYISPSAMFQNHHQNIKRRQSDAETEFLIDSLSPDFYRTFESQHLGFSLKRNSAKSNLNATLMFEHALLSTSLNKDTYQRTHAYYFVPNISWNYDYRTGKQIKINYQTAVIAPSANQLLPVTDNSNALQLYTGNRALKSEYHHNAQLYWIFFDQFSFTSIMTSLQGSYIQNKINWNKTVNTDLSEENNLINVDHDFSMNGGITISTPIRKLGLDINVSLNERFKQDISYINEIENINNTWSHSVKLGINNRKTEHFDIQLGGNFTLNNSSYNQNTSQNKVYFNTEIYADIAYTPTKDWHIASSNEISTYTDNTFGSSISIPLMSIECTRYLLKNNRGMIQFNIFDLLNKNQGIERLSSMNYLSETQSNSIGRHFMLSLKYRLNKFDQPSGLNIKMTKR